MNLNDLFKPAWQSRNKEKALKAVHKIFDEEKLKEIALAAINTDVCIAAVKKIKDQSLLKYIAELTRYPSVKIAALNNITDHSVLADYVVKNCKWSNRQHMFDILMDLHQSAIGSALKRLSSNDFGKGSKEYAFTIGNEFRKYLDLIFKKITDQPILLDISLNAKEWEIRTKASSHLTDKTLKREFVKTTKDITSLKEEMCDSHEWKTTSSQKENEPCKVCIHCGKKEEHLWTQGKTDFEKLCSVCGAKRCIHEVINWNERERPKASNYDYDIMERKGICIHCGKEIDESYIFEGAPY